MALVALAAVLVGCGSSAASSAPGSGASGASAAAATAGPNASGSQAARTFPPPQTAIEPGTYRWDGFERDVSVELGTGWALGHNNASFFDLFRGSDFPSITFARFTDIYVHGITRAKATDAATVASTLAAREDMTVTDPSTIELGGLTGRQFDVVTTQPRTPLFYGPAGDFQLDPEFKTRYRVLDFPGGGVLVIGVHTRDGRFDEGLALGDPVVATLTLEP
jgi:hypothetical protein